MPDTLIRECVRNPILPDYHADPSAHEWDGRYWIYPSHDITGSKRWDMVDWHAFSSTDLVRWTDHGVIFSLKDTTWASRWAWAPDCMKRNGKYYFYFTADEQIGVAVSDSPAGPFRDALGRPLIERRAAGTRVMDPAVLVDDDGQAYLYFGQNHPRVVKLKEDMITLDGPFTELQVENFHEGIWVHKRQGTYYVSYCARQPNRMEYAMGSSPVGPFVYKGLVLDSRSRNVQGSIVQFNDRGFVFYHVQGPSPFERRVCCEYLDYNSDGTIRPVAMTRAGVELDGQGPGGPSRPGTGLADSIHTTVTQPHAGQSRPLQHRPQTVPSASSNG